jgi:hypothetical protein
MLAQVSPQPSFLLYHTGRHAENRSAASLEGQFPIVDIQKSLVARFFGKRTTTICEDSDHASFGDSEKQ